MVCSNCNAINTIIDFIQEIVFCYSEVSVDGCALMRLVYKRIFWTFFH